MGDEIYETSKDNVLPCLSLRSALDSSDVKSPDHALSTDYWINGLFIFTSSVPFKTCTSTQMRSQRKDSKPSTAV